MAWESLLLLVCQMYGIYVYTGGSGLVVVKLDLFLKNKDLVKHLDSLIITIHCKWIILPAPK